MSRALAQPRRSPLSVVVLALLQEEPMHSYRMHKLISERGKDRVVNVVQRNSVQQALHRLLRDELIAVHDRQQDANYPERVLYRITGTGTKALYGWLEHMLSTPTAEYPRFPAALAFLALTSPDHAATLLRCRRDALARQEEEQCAGLAARPDALPRIFVVEEEYALAILRAEIGWLDSILAELAAGTLNWDTQHLLDTKNEHGS